LAHAPLDCRRGLDAKFRRRATRWAPQTDVTFLLAILILNYYYASAACKKDAPVFLEYRGFYFHSSINIRWWAMAKVFRTSSRESSILSKIESTKEHMRRVAIGRVRDCAEPLANGIATKLVESNLVETTNKNALEEQIGKCLDKLGRLDDFDIDYQVAPFRNLVPHPQIVSLYVTAFVIEKLINHKDVVDIFGSDEEIYFTINKQVKKFMPL
jgi:hypothetical protein